MTIYVDNTVLSNFAAVRRPDLLHVALGDQGVLLEQVYAEFVAGVRLGHLPDVDYTWFPVRPLSPSAHAQYEIYRQGLGRGESACLAEAVASNGRVLTDDRDARNLAARLRIPVRGTLGVLTQLVRLAEMQLDEGNRLLHTMISAGYYAPMEDLNDLI